MLFLEHETVAFQLVFLRLFPCLLVSVAVFLLLTENTFPLMIIYTESELFSKQVNFAI